MMKIPSEIASFLEKQNFVVISTINSSGQIHNSCKDIVEIDTNGKIFLLDLYLNNTFKNLKSNPRISLAVVDEHKFKGFSLSGKAELVKREDLENGIIKKWDEKINSRISQRLVKNIQGIKGHPSHPETKFPKPKYMIIIDVESITDLTPPNLK